MIKQLHITQNNARNDLGGNNKNEKSENVIESFRNRRSVSNLIERSAKQQPCNQTVVVEGLSKKMGA